jgi:hypothetical protein
MVEYVMCVCSAGEAPEHIIICAQTSVSADRMHKDCSLALYHGVSGLPQ